MKKLLLLSMTMLFGAAALAGDGGFLFVTFKGEGTPMEEQIYFALCKYGKRDSP